MSRDILKAFDEARIGVASATFESSVRRSLQRFRRAEERGKKEG
ncbi:MAG: hypothetical protein MPW16_04035 [Candidatus Manganitrophus sp.]|nr:MAG: hypothetical protein MPW16_04035 [Candidatus Manganitrophus sp.]